MDFTEKKQFMTAHELTILHRLGEPKEAEYVPCVKKHELEGQVPLPGKAIKVMPEPPAPDAKKEALKSYVYEIEYKLSNLGFNFQKIESSKVILKENLIILETPCPRCGVKKLGTAVSVLYNMTPEKNAIKAHGEYKKCVCYDCGNTTIFIFVFNYKMVQ